MDSSQTEPGTIVPTQNLNVVQLHKNETNILESNGCEKPAPAQAQPKLTFYHGNNPDFPDDSSLGTGSDDEDTFISNSNVGRDITNLSKYFICDSKLHERILAFLGLEDLLSCRLVCQNWYKLIGGSELLLWKKASMKFSLCRLQSTAPRGYGNSDLIKQFHCPNFSFHYSDMRDDLHRNFFIIQGLKIKYIRIANCYVSKATFDLIILWCPNLQHFEVHCVTRSISLCEALFTVSHMNSYGFLLKLPHLETLYLKRMDPQDQTKYALQDHNRNSKTKIRKHGADLATYENFDGQNISSLFLEQLLESCTKLKRIQLSGWQQATTYNLLNILNSWSQLFTSLKELVVDEIPGTIDDSLFLPLCSQPRGFQLRKLTISLKEPLEPEDTVTASPEVDIGDTSAHTGSSLDTIFQKALEFHCETLQELNLDNLPVSGSIFQIKFPKLHKLSLESTWVDVDDVSRFIELMPKLEVLDHSLNRQKQNHSKIQSSSFKKRKFIFPPQFFRCTSLDHICMISFGSMLGILVTILLIYQFETYGQWFLCMGLILLGVICTADFLQFHCSNNS